MLLPGICAVQIREPLPQTLAKQHEINGKHMNLDPLKFTKLSTVFVRSARFKAKLNGLPKS